MLTIFGGPAVEERIPTFREVRASGRGIEKYQAGKEVFQLAVKTKATVIERPGVAAFRDVTLTPKHDDTVVCRRLSDRTSPNQR